jgi:fucose permease
MISIYMIGIGLGILTLIIVNYITSLGCRTKNRQLRIIVILFHWSYAVSLVFLSNYILDAVRIGIVGNGTRFAFFLLWGVPYTATAIWGMIHYCKR